MRKNKKTLKLHRDTIRSLSHDILTEFAGGSAPCSFTLCGSDNLCYYAKSGCPGATCLC